MRQEPVRHTDAADRIVKDICRKKRKRYSAEDITWFMQAALHGEETIAKPCRQAGYSRSPYYNSPKEFMVCLSAKPLLQINKVERG